MKGIIVTLPKKQKEKKQKFSFFVSVKKYSALCFYTFCFAVGMLMGSLSAGSAENEVMNSMDFLFSTNLSARLSQPMYMTFASGLASNFLFLLAAFLCALSLWGIIPLFMVPAFKGYGTGLSAGYLFVNFGLKGVGFYLLVILAGTFISTFALIIECAESHRMSFRMAQFFLGDKLEKGTMITYLRSFMLRSFFSLILAVAAALCDMLLWTFFAKMFF